MRYLSVFLTFAGLSLSVTTPAATASIVSAQTSAQEKVANLRAQLTEVETKQAELQTRLQNLEENLKPENIEKALAGVGSTHPEDLREQRRRQLEIERNGVRAQLDVLATSHSRLDTAIASADAEAYRQSATPVKGPSVETSATPDVSPQAATPQRRPRRIKRKKTRKSRRTHHLTQTNSLRTAQQASALSGGASPQSKSLVTVISRSSQVGGGIVVALFATQG
jgi:chromosome segregation ATPase